MKGGVRNGYLEVHAGGSDDFWHVRLTLADGRKTTRSLRLKVWERRSVPPAGYARPREAEAALRDVLEGSHPFIRYSPTGDVEITVREACGKYLAECERRGKKPTTLIDYAQENERLCEAFGGDSPITAVSERDIEEWQVNLRADGLTPRTMNKRLTHLRAVFGNLMRLGIADENPAKRVSHVVDRRERPDNALRLEELMKLVECAETREDGVLILFIGHTGLRKGEILALRWRDVDLDRQTLHIRRSFAKGHETTPKSGKSRSMPLSNVAVALLEERRATSPYTAPGDFVFCRPTGERLGDSFINTRIKKALRAAGLPQHVTAKELRHTFASILVRGYTDAEALRAYMGHSSLAVTSIYSHYRRMDDEADRLSEAFSPGEGKSVRRKSGARLLGVGPAPYPSYKAESHRSDGPGRTRTSDLRIMSPLL